MFIKWHTFYTAVEIISLITSNNIDEFHKQCWLKEARQERVHVVWFSFYEVPKQAKLISDVRGHRVVVTQEIIGREHKVESGSWMLVICFLNLHAGYTSVLILWKHNCLYIYYKWIFCYMLYILLKSKNRTSNNNNKTHSSFSRKSRLKLNK